MNSPLNFEMLASKEIQTCYVRMIKCHCFAEFWSRREFSVFVFVLILEHASIDKFEAIFT